MAEATVRAPGVLAPAGRAWGRISPSLVPVFAVLTAMLLTIPFMILTGGRGDVGRGLSIAGTAYSALIEGSLGIAINDQVSRDNLDQLLSLAANDELSQADLRRLGQDVEAVAVVGLDNANRYQEILATLGTFDEETLADLSTGITDIRRIGVETLEPMRPLIAELMEADRGEVRAAAELFAAAESVDAEARAAVEALASSAASLSDEDLLRYMQIVNEDGIVRLSRLVETIDQLAAANIDINGAVAGDIAAIATLDLGSQNPSPEQSAGAVVQAVTVSQNLQRAGIADPIALASQIQTVRAMYEQGVLTDSNVSAALQNELDTAIANSLVVRRPGDRIVVGGSGLFGAASSQNENGYYLRLGGSALLFFPERLESMIVRSIPFIIAGLAVALGFKAGVFNIGAEGQLYAGGIFAVWIGYSGIFAGLPLIIHLPLMLIAGLIGGFLWGAIPGMLKAYTGAHEVITTIMLNFIAVRLVDWLIKSTEPIIMRDPDPAVSIPRTPLIADSARMPRITDISPWVFVIAGIVILLLAAWSRREQIRQNWRAIIRPVILGVVAAGLGLFLQFINVRGALHIGFFIMLAAVWFTDWFLNKTTLGFELRTVGANSDAAKYAGMNVRWNVVLALALGGALAGLAGTIEISAVQYTMQPAFFAGVGFDAIAVALLARSNPRNMPIAGLLWGALLTGAGLMQIRADISIDLVKIIQALIIMFIAAHAIIRYLWRVPKSDEKVANVFAKGWGS
jgi:general nucleoside transport system permease protein